MAEELNAKDANGNSYNFETLRTEIFKGKEIILSKVLSEYLTGNYVGHDVKSEKFGLGYKILLNSSLDPDTPKYYEVLARNANSSENGVDIVIYHLQPHTNKIKGTLSEYLTKLAETHAKTEFTKSSKNRFIFGFISELLPDIAEKIDVAVKNGIVSEFWEIANKLTNSIFVDINSFEHIIKELYGDAINLESIRENILNKESFAKYINRYFTEYNETMVNDESVRELMINTIKSLYLGNN